VEPIYLAIKPNPGMEENPRGRFRCDLVGRCFAIGKKTKVCQIVQEDDDGNPGHCILLLRLGVSPLLSIVNASFEVYKLLHECNGLYSLFNTSAF
jgi:hypothetical protein